MFLASFCFAIELGWGEKFFSFFVKHNKYNFKYMFYAMFAVQDTSNSIISVEDD